MSQLFAWGGQSTGVSALALFPPKKSQGWSPSEWTGWIYLQSKGLSRVFSNTTVQKHQFFGAQLSSQSNSHPYMTTGKTIALTRQTFVSKVLLSICLCVSGNVLIHGNVRLNTIHVVPGPLDFLSARGWEAGKIPINKCVKRINPKNINSIKKVR